MIAYIKGVVINKSDDYVVIENNNIGYKVFCGSDILNSHGAGSKLEMHISHIIREDKNDLYGFKTIDKKLFFELLMSVSGVGPKMALGIMELDGLDKLKSAIAHGDTAYLTQISGIGAKTAKRMVIDLQDKLNSFASSSWNSADNDIIEALKALGFDAKEVREYISQIPSDMKTDSEKIKFVLSLKNK